MTYETSTAQFSKKIAAILLIIAVPIAGNFLFRPAFSYLSKGTATTAERFETEIAGHPEVKQQYEILRAKFPREYGQLKRDVIKIAEAGASETELRLLRLNYMKRFFVLHKYNIAQAPTNELRNARAKFLAAAEALRAESPEMCGRFLTTGLAFGDEPSPKAVRAIRDQTVAQLEAVAAGKAAPANRKVGHVSDADTTTLLAHMRQNGINEARMRAFMTDTSVAQSASSEQCEILIKVHEALMTMPNATADRITAFFWASSQ